MRYCERARSVWRIESFRFRFGLLFVFVVVVGSNDGSEAEAARSSIVSIYRIRWLANHPNTFSASAYYIRYDE